MPWTFSHPAAVFPLKNLPGGRLLNLPALIMKRNIMFKVNQYFEYVANKGKI